ncbi:hypothetical protein KR222_008247, partial [Zaprionus bogoriensis]
QSAAEQNKSESASISKCKPNEVLTLRKGCISRDFFMERVLQQTWMGESLDNAKNRIGLEVKIDCKEGEILTAFGCAPEIVPPRISESERVIVKPSHLYGDQVYKSEDGIPFIDKQKKLADLVGTNNIITGESHILEDNTRSLDSERPTAHRPGSYVFLPGRLLKSGRKCRPYEVLARHNRCIRRRGQTGVYEHKDHVY